MDKENAKKVADDIFSRYPNEKKVFVTEDGQAFTREVHAKNHSANNRNKKELEIFTFRSEEKQIVTAKTSAKDAIAQIAITETVESVAGILEAEKTGENRKSVIEAAEKRIAELSKKAEQ